MNEIILENINRYKEILLGIYKNHPDIIQFLDDLDNEVIPENLDFTNTPYDEKHVFSFSRDYFIKEIAQTYFMYGKVSVDICSSLKNHIKDKKSS
jgi:hypothetical protein